MRSTAFAIAATLALMACTSGPDQPDRAPPAPPDRPHAASSAAAPQPASSELPAIAPPPDPGLAGVAGSWEGKFDAKKGSVAMPANVKDKERDADDGKASAGSGQVKLTVSREGDVKGSWTGALGTDTLSGRVDIDKGRTMIRLSAFPEDLAAPDGMTGVLVGEVQGDVIHAELHVAGRDATRVREAKFDLARK